jgi:hypothetical protein
LKTVQCGRCENTVEIDTAFVEPPIAMRRFDWLAIFPGYEGGDPIGYGATEADAMPTSSAAKSGSAASASGERVGRG